MNNLNKKCAIASAGLHVLLVTILFIGPAFLAPQSKPQPDIQLLDFVPFETVDALVSGGGDPKARPPAAAPNIRPDPQAAIVPPTPPPQKPEPEVKKPDPEPEPEVVKPQPRAQDREPEPKKEASMEVSSKPVKKKLELKPVVRKTGPSASKKAADAAAEREAKEYAEYKKNLVGTIRSAANGLPDSISSSTQVGFVGPGGGGPPYANFLAAVKTVYTRAWALPDGVSDDDATVQATVTIARDGSVVSSRISRRSGNSAVDASVQATLDRVTYAAPLPRTATENTRTVEINFNVKAKKLIG